MEITFHRPPNNDEFRQTKAEKDILSYAVLFQCSNAVAYAIFNPHLTDSNGKLNKAGQKECRQFFTHPNNIAYMEALKEHLNALTNGQRIEEKTECVDDKRKDNALKSLLNRAMSLVENGGEDIDAETLKTISDIFKKVGLLKDDVEFIMPPLRFLPARCSKCRMKIAVESMVLNGQMLDMCAYCKARKKAEESGFRFDEGKNLLDIPKDVLDALERKNNVKIEDIMKAKAPQ